MEAELGNEKRERGIAGGENGLEERCVSCIVAGLPSMAFLEEPSGQAELGNEKDLYS